MPPPSFSHAPPASGGGHQQSSSGHAGPSLNDLPKVQRALVRDVLQAIRLSLTSSESTSPANAAKNSATAYRAIYKLLADPGIEKQAEIGSNAGVASVQSSSAAAGDAAIGHAAHRKTSEEHRAGAGTGQAASNNADSQPQSLRAQVSAVLETVLFDVFSDEMDQESSPKCQLLVSYLFVLKPVLNPLCVVREWWDVLLRPILKDMHCHPEVARRAQQLVIWTMSCTPVESYVDEAAPSAIWPPTEQSAIAAEEMRSRRKPGEAPYPVSSTRTYSPDRSSHSGDTRRSTLFSAVRRPREAKHPLWRFTHRIFDMYTTEASSASLRHLEEDDIQDVDEGNNDGAPDASTTMGDSILDNSLHNASADTGPTYKGNLEAIILAFGEERPKAFFHHLSDAFVEPHARIPILLLLTIFFRISSLHAYHVVSTPFVRLLILSLQLDTSKLSAALGVYALATLIPHIPNWIANGGAGGLPALLSILARAIDWRKLGQHWEERSVANEGAQLEEAESLERISRRLRLRDDIVWDRLDTRSDSTTNPAPPDAEMLFTFLYGIFPCNVIRFLRAPIDYLRKAEYESPFQMDWEDIIDEEAVQHKSAPILRRHILHPSLVDMTAEREISDKQRWLEHDAADITAECVCLNIKQASLTVAGETDPLSAWDIFSQGSSRPLIHQGDMHSNIVSQRRPTETTLNEPHRLEKSFLDNSHLTSDLFLGRDNIPAVTNRLRRARSDHLSVFDRQDLLKRISRQNGNNLRAAEDDSAIDSDPLLVTSPGSVRALKASESSVRQAENAESEQLLQNHIRLRYGISQQSPRSGMGTPVESGMSRSSSTLSHSASPTRVSQRASTSSAQNPMQFSAEVGLRALASRYKAVNKDVAPLPNVMSAEDGKRAKAVLREEVVQNIAYLKQENLQLRNELNYEIGQKDQMLRHIGRIHRDRIKETAREDERQNLYQLVRALRAQLKTVKESAERAKSEAVSFKNRHSRWEDELNAKVKQFREERRIWTNEVRQLQIIKEDREALIAKLEKQLHENADEVFEMRQQCKRDAQKIGAIQGYENKANSLEACLELWNDDMRKFELSQREANAYAHRCEELEMLLRSSDKELRAADSAAHESQARSQALCNELELAKATISRLRTAQENMLGITNDRSRAGQAASPTSPTPGDGEMMSQSVAETKEVVRLRARLEQLEGELLAAKARNEERQMQKLLDKLQRERARSDVDRSHQTRLSLAELDAANDAVSSTDRNVQPNEDPALGDVEPFSLETKEAESKE